MPTQAHLSQKQSYQGKFYQRWCSNDLEPTAKTSCTYCTRQVYSAWDTFSKNLKLMAIPILNELLLLTTLFASAPYYKLFQRGTYRPIKRILESQTDADARTGLQEWCRYKTREAGYVQVAVSTPILFS